MATKIVDLSILFESGAAMWPQLAADIQYGAQTFAGIRSTGWQNKNHPGWFDMGHGFPFGMGTGQLHGHKWVGHTHPGTHVDAPVYCIPEGVSAEKIPLDKLIGTGVVIDMRSKGKWDTITAEDFEKATPKIEADDFVVVNTGWQKYWTSDNSKTYDYYNYYPGMVPSAAQWLIDKKVKAIAGTWPVCDHPLSFAPLEKNMPWVYNDYKREMGKEPPVEKLGGFEECLTMLLKSGITCIQNAGGDIDEVTGQRCKFFALPFRMEEADGAMVRLVALIEQ